MNMRPMTEKDWEHFPNPPPPPHGTLQRGEPHPSAYTAKAWILGKTATDLGMWQESFSSCAIEGNRLAEICSETLRRLQNGEPVSDRYVMGLYVSMREGLA